MSHLLTTWAKPLWQSGRQLTLLIACIAIGSRIAVAQTLPQVPVLTPQQIPTVDFGEPQEHGVWWDDQVTSPLLQHERLLNLTLEGAIFRALKHSRQVRVASDLPLIRETSITEAQAAFDWSAFADSQWDDLSSPIGNSLTAGAGATRFEDHNLTFSAGARRRTQSGGQIEISQQFGIRENNSQFFVPNNQGSSRLVLNFTQPLLRGKGETYNRSLICLASIDQKVSQAELMRQLQDHLQEVVRSYWAIYLERGNYVQQVKSFERARDIAGRIQRRRRIDSSEVMIRTAEAALRTREANLVRSRAAIKNAEAKLQALVNDPELADFENIEIVSAMSPDYDPSPIDMQVALQDASTNRPEVHQELRRIKAASIRCNMSKHELLPALNLVTEVYVAGLEDRRNIGRAFANQLNSGSPGYSIGFQFEVPIHNRAAKARHQRRRLELRQMQNQYAATLETITLDVQVAAREVATSAKELLGKQQAMEAQTRQTEAMLTRFERLPGEGDTAAAALVNLLNAQDRVTISEYEFLKSQVTHSLSLINLRRATGTLLQHEMVSIGRACVNCLPTNIADTPMSAVENEVTR